MLGGFTRSLSALVHFTLHTGAGVDSVVYIMYNLNCDKINLVDLEGPATSAAPAPRGHRCCATLPRSRVCVAPVQRRVRRRHHAAARGGAVGLGVEPGVVEDPPEGS